MENMQHLLSKMSDTAAFFGLRALAALVEFFLGRKEGFREEGIEECFNRAALV
jgi:hypothetical protein